MKDKSLLILLLILFLFLRLLALKDNNFFFTMDQAQDALDVRQILSGRLTLKGPLTAIKGVHIGPLWDYFLCLGYFIFQGHPVGAVIMLILFNLGVFLLSWFVFKKKLSLAFALIANLGLIFLPIFFDTSFYAFNPHLMPGLVLLFIFGLSLIKKKKKFFFLLSALVMGISWHSELAFAPVLALLYLAGGLYFLKKHILDLKTFCRAKLILGFCLIFHFISEILNNFEQSKALLWELQNPAGVMAKLNFWQQAKISALTHFKVAGQAGLGINSWFVGALVIALLGFYFLKAKPGFAKRYVFLSLILFFLSLIWFSLSRGLSSWHLLGLILPIFFSFLLSLYSLRPHLFGTIASLLVIFVIFISFFSKIPHYFFSGSDQSFLSNELKAIDLTYAQSGNQNFSVYIFLPSVYDLPYQYLYPWHGAKKYQRLPCEYSTLPGISANSYVLDSFKYQQTPACQAKIFYLIIEPYVEEKVFKNWYTQATKNSLLERETMVAKIKVEKRLKI